MPSVLKETEEETQSGKGHVKTEVETGVMQPQALNTMSEVIRS